jgi:hemerythrin
MEDTNMPWNPNLSVGVDLIDEQHKKWFEMADQLFDAGRNRKAGEYIAQMFRFLEDYTKKHFGDEEKYMKSIQYPEYDVQKMMHEDFIRELGTLKKQYDQSGGNISVILDANQMVLNWLTNHISRQDKKIGDFVNVKSY